MGKRNKFFWGLLFIAAAVLIIAMQFTTFEQIGVWSIIGGILLLGVLIESAIRRSFLGILVPLALLYAIFSQPLGLMQISVWLLLLAAVLLGTGLEIVFHKWSHDGRHGWHEHFHGDVSEFTKTTENSDDNRPVAKISFGKVSRYLHADAFEQGFFSASFGELDVFFDEVTLKDNEGQIEVDCSFGEMKLFVPRNWLVVSQVHPSFGTFNNDTYLNRPGENPPRLHIVGDISFGEVKIQYI